jgi:predicted short-subunit dehydrogenase-like oxidoreductase (DUF2520 family)
VADEGGAALTGPIARGDVATVRAHLAVLPPSLREAYRALGKVALEMTKLEPERRAAVEAELSAAVQFPNQ